MPKNRFSIIANVAGLTLLNYFFFHFLIGLPEKKIGRDSGAHEGRQDSRDRVDGVPEDKTKHPQPNDLVDERGHSGEEEACDEDASGRMLGRGRGRPPMVSGRSS